jgi:hypothetical protein
LTKPKKFSAKPLEKNHIFKEVSHMNEYPNTVKERLSSLIGEMAENPMLFVKNPGKDFTRNRKLPFEDVVNLLISMGGNSMCKELLESQGYDTNTATTSAFIQQRDKILPCAFEYLLHEFTRPFSDIKKYRGYRLLATDGSDLHIPTNPQDADTYYLSNPNGSGHNLLHLNAMYDLCSRIYVDALIQPSRQENECKALIDMVGRSHIKDNVIVIADRAYESYNNFAHIEQKGWNYLIRVKDVDRKRNGILSGLCLPTSGEFDVCIQRTLTKKSTNEVKARPDIYRNLSNKVNFDFLDLHTNKFYPMAFRVVRFKITEDSYETVITNLGQSDFSPQELKKLYKMRWGIETSFRELKYAVGLTSFHSKKREHIAQEVFARIIMYNFAEMITSHVVISQSHTKHNYQVNFTMAIHICRHFLRLWSNAPPPDVEALIRKNILPVRPDRKDGRKIRYKTAVSFLYRVA